MTRIPLPPASPGKQCGPLRPSVVDYVEPGKVHDVLPVVARVDRGLERGRLGYAFFPEGLDAFCAPAGARPAVEGIDDAP